MRYGGLNDIVPDVVDTDGNNTGINLRITDGFKSRGFAGPISTGLYHDDATYDSYYTNLGHLAEVTLENLNPLSTFDLTIFASSAFDAANDGVGEYTIGGTTLILDATDNTTETITFTGIQADANGEIVISLHASDDTGYAFINVMDIVESTPNQAPIAVADNDSVDESNSVSIDVLANDSDADASSVAIYVDTVGAVANGTAQVVGDQITNTPNPGFYGMDVFSYTISDGQDTDSASVTITVNNTSTAGDLTSVGLTASIIGTGASSNSRILASGDWEINGAGLGLAGTADSIVLEAETVIGDFQALAKIHSVSGGYNTTSRYCDT